MSMFNPDQFLDSTFNESNSTEILPIPEGEYPAVIEGVKARPWQSKKDPTQSGVALDVTWGIVDPALADQLGRQKVTVKQGIMLDLTDAGGLDFSKGANVTLGRLREAVGLNVPGQPFSFNMLVARQAKITVSQRIDGDKIYNDVKAVTRF